MLDSFLDREFFIRITKDDKDLLNALALKVNLRWNSGDRLNSATTEQYLDAYREIFIKPSGEKNNFCPTGIHYKLRSQIGNATYVDLKEFLDYKPIIIEEDELVGMFDA